MWVGQHHCAGDRVGSVAPGRWGGGRAAELGLEAQAVGGVQLQGAGAGFISHGWRRYRRSVTTSQTVEMLSEGVGRSGENLPIKMLNDRVLVDMGGPEGERRSTGGILIPATAQMGKRLVWAEVVAVGPNVRAMEPGDQVLFNPEDRYEVEVRGNDYVILRERDVHAVAAERLAEGSTGLYL
jgi:chaperonin GroES